MSQPPRRARVALATAFLLVPLLIALLAPVVRGSAEAVGVIAFKRGHQIRLVNSDGTGDRLLWSAALPGGFRGIRGLQWRPDGGALAFASDFQATCSVYDGDIYTIVADGSSLKRLTNSPACGALAGFPKGSVTVQVENAVANLSQFLIYVEGAATAKVVTIAPGAVVNVTLDGVADLGNVLQQAVAINGGFRWFDAAVMVDVKAGQTVQVPARLVLRPSGNVFDGLGARLPTWHHSGSRVGFVFYEGIPMQIGANPPPGGPDSLLLGPGAGVIADSLAWSPVDDRLLYSDSDSISVVLPGASGPGNAIIDKAATELVLGMDWLPDGSGFILAVTGGALGQENSNLYEYSFSQNSLRPITDFADDFAGGLSVSTDGQWIVFEFIDAIGDAPTLWMIRRNGTGLRPLGIQGESPDWRPGTGIDFTERLFLPLQRK